MTSSPAAVTSANEDSRFRAASVLVLDSSAIASIFFPDKLEEFVTKTIQRYSNFQTMDIAYAEVGSVAWKSISIFKQAFEPSYEALRRACDFISDNCEVVSSKEILNEALELAAKHKIQIYDSLFLSLARRLNSKVLTTDERLHNKLSAVKELREITIYPSRKGAA